MSRDKVRQEIAEFLKREDNMFRNDRQAALERIMDREFFERQEAHAINRIDIMQIVSNAGDYMAKKAFPVVVSKKQIDMNEVRHVAMIESIISYLNRCGLLNKEVQIDYTSNEYQFDSIED